MREIEVGKAPVIDLLENASLADCTAEGERIGRWYGDFEVNAMLFATNAAY